MAGVNVPDVPRYFSQLGLENPATEALTYDWTYSTCFPGAVSPSRTLVTRTASPSYDMSDTAYACRLDVEDGPR